jgi:hypothetical protein
VNFKPGDVLSYVPVGGWHARQGTAIVDERGCAVDTFWGVQGYSDGHVLSEAELAEAELKFRLGDYCKLGEHWDRKHDEWLTYAPEDRQMIGSQIQNARNAVEDAERGVSSAENRLHWARQDLARLESLRVGA